MRRRISWLVLATSSAIVASFVIPLCLLVSTLAQDRAVAAADQEARNIAILVTGVTDRSDLNRLVTDLDARAYPATSVVTPGGRTLAGDGTDLSDDPEVMRAQTGSAFTVVDSRGARVLLPVVLGDGTAVVRSQVTSADLSRGVHRAWAGIGGLGLVLLVSAWLIASRLGRRVSAPLREVAAVAHRMREGDLDDRAEVSGTEETVELARALNGLAERTVELLAIERAAVADLSHRLRTPVTALRLDVDAVSDPVLAERLQEHIGALQRTVDAIVKEARRPVRTDLTATADAGLAVRERVAFWTALADDQGRRCTVDLPEEVLLAPLPADDLADIVDVLIDNVFAHTPDGTAFSVSLHRAGADLVLMVDDVGPGPAGRKGDQRPGTTGLGLDIVGRTARAAGGRVTVTATSPGTRVEVVLPLSRRG
ncbi:HAMP domain-containing sensor histidine kinase [soil metagenome]